MIFFSFVLAPMIFKILDAENAGKFVRKIFPYYYFVNLIFLSIAVILFIIISSLGLSFYITLSLAISFIFAQFILMPIINKFKDNNEEKVNHQKIVINEIKIKINNLLTESFESKKYDYLGEERTFNEDSIVEELEELVINDINIGEADRARLEETKSENPNLEKMIVNEKRLRKANEGRARNKNKIDKILKSSLNE